ncbi:MAG: DUF3347 domain-containing protein [Bacteroidales bacterium]
MQEGEEIATSGVFRIDAAAQLLGLPSMMSPEGGMLNSVHDHGSVEGPVDSRFTGQLSAFYRSYLIMKDAFVSSDPVKVTAGASDALGRLGAIDMKLLGGDAHKFWMDRSADLEKILTMIRNEMISKNRGSYSQESARCSTAF